MKDTKRLQLEGRENMYFKYTRYYSEGDFRISISKDFGELLWAMAPLKDTEDFIENLPDFSKNNYVWSNLGTKELITFQFLQKDPNYCNNCTYVIVVQGSEGDSSFTILVSGSNQIVYLQDAKSFKDYVNKGENNSYVSYLL